MAATRFGAIADSAASLPARAGHGTVAGNLTDATLTLFGSSAIALVTLIAARPSLAPAVEHAGADTRKLAFTLLGTSITWS